MNFSKIYALGLRHIYLISNSLPRIIDLIYWPTVQIFLWGFISKFFTLSKIFILSIFGFMFFMWITDSTPNEAIVQILNGMEEASEELQKELK